MWPDSGCPILYFILQYRKAADSQWTLGARFYDDVGGGFYLCCVAVSNALKPQRKTSITGLTPATQYVVRVEAYNIAGFNSGEFYFATLTKEGGECGQF